MNSLRKRIALPFIFPSIGKSFLFISIIISVSALLSCNSAKKVTYFSDLTDSLRVQLPEMKNPEAVIMPDDMLEIKFAGANEQTTALFNNYGGTPSNTSGTLPNYLVDLNGEVEFPLLGKVKAAGFTREQFKDNVRQAVTKYLKDPIVNVRFANFRFTVLGEVRSPGSFVLSNAKVSILEALGQAGDMTQYAKRNTVRVIRDSSGKREIGTINFNQKTVFTSPYYYLQRNDVVYVEPEQSKSGYESVTRVASILGTVLGIIAVTYSLIRN